MAMKDTRTPQILNPGSFCRRYEVRLHPGQLTLTPLRPQVPADEEAAACARSPTVVHLSDGHTRVEKLQGPDTFTLVTHRNAYQ